jgi:hypothetical protein
MNTLLKSIKGPELQNPHAEGEEPLFRTPGSDYKEGRDEMNLAELPLSSIADRFLDGRKTVVFVDEFWDRELGQRATRELAISGSDRYGLPTASDEDVLLACVQLSSMQKFRDRDVHFSRYELLKLLRWPDEGKYYRRLAVSLRRWKGVTIYSNRAFYDHARKSWVNRDFGVLDNLYIYEREASEGAQAPASSRFRWNEVFFESFQSGYLKKLDWDLYCRLTTPVAKRLYRLLDKRFYHADEVTMDLHHLAFRKIRLSDGYNTGQIKRALAAGLQELESLWDLRPLPASRRFVNRGRGKWEVVFERRKPPETKAALARSDKKVMDLTAELTRREIGPATAADLVEGHPAETVRAMIELFDWYDSKGERKGPGFLVDSIRNPSKYRLPRELRSHESPNGAKRPERITRQRSKMQPPPTQVKSATETDSSLKAFDEFWQRLGPDRREEFEAAAVMAAGTMKRECYLRTKTCGGPAFEEYRQLVLRDHFVSAKGDIAR